MISLEERKIVGVEDMVLLPTINEQHIVKNLEKRFKSDQIYTTIGPVLVCCNPFRWLKLYEPSYIKLYSQGSTDTPPHIFSVAASAFQLMTQEEEKQCVIISGESGAGKTEAAKQIMNYVAAVSGTGGNDAAVAKIKNVILDSNPALESFGNAMTLRNNNSSRFGKYFEINFSLANGGTPQGGFITNYLLEKSRVVKPGAGERSFHIFYQLLAGSPSEIRSSFKLGSPKDYKVLANSGSYHGDDALEYKETVQSLETIGLTAQEQLDFFLVVAVCLHLSNIEFVDHKVDGAEGSRITNMGMVDVVASLLHVDSQSLGFAVTHRTLSTMAAGGEVETYQVPLSPVQARAARDALAKDLYSRTFDLLVAKVNSGLEMDGKIKEPADEFEISIGVLDIYGFEIFENNLFEQFCINYVNEKLQQVFISLTIKSEQLDYQREGIAWTPIPFFDNQVVCALVEGKKPPGLLPILDDMCKRLTRMTSVDDKFLEQCQTFLGSNAHFTKLGNDKFLIKHYAGDVEYSVIGFMESNKDILNTDLKLLAQSSQVEFIRSLYPEVVNYHDKHKGTTAGFKIRSQCVALVDTLLSANPHYVRCIKSNSKKKSKVFESELVKHQVRYLGLQENIKVRRAGFAFRVEFIRFISRFRVIAAGRGLSDTMISGSDREIAEAVLKEAKKYITRLNDAGEVQLGKEKVFIKHPETVLELQSLRKKLIAKKVVKIQTIWRRFMTRRELVTLREEIMELWRSDQKQSTAIDLLRPFSAFYATNEQAAAISTFLETKKEKLKYSDSVLKFNKQGVAEKVLLFITNKALYHGVWTQDDNTFVLRRRTELTMITGILLSLEADDFMGIKVTPQEKLATPDKSVFIDKKSVKRCMETQTKFSFFGRHKHRCHETGGVYIREVVSTKICLPDKGYYTPVEVHTSVVGTVSTEMREDMFIETEKKAELAGVLRELVTIAKGGSKTMKPSVPKASPKQMCKALYAYTTARDDELSLGEGDVIELLDDADGEWWKGKLLNKIGLFPANYVERIQTKANLTVSTEQHIYKVNITFSNQWQCVPAVALSNTIQQSIQFLRNGSFRQVNCQVEEKGKRLVVNVPPGVAAQTIQNIRRSQAARTARQEQERAELDRRRQANASKRAAERKAAKMQRIEEKKEARRKLRGANAKITATASKPAWAKPSLHHTIPNNATQNGSAPSKASFNPQSVPNKTKQNMAKSIPTQNKKQPPAIPAKSFSRKPLKKKKIVVALYDYQANEGDELSLVAGEEVEVIDSTDKDWWKGVVNGKQGLFPASYTKEIAPKNGVTPSSKPTPTATGTSTGKEGTMSYEQVIALKTDCPADIDRSRLEIYLSPQVFKDTFGITAEEFQALPKWKQIAQRKKHKLF